MENCSIAGVGHKSDITVCNTEACTGRDWRAQGIYFSQLHGKMKGQSISLRMQMCTEHLSYLYT